MEIQKNSSLRPVLICASGSDSQVQFSGIMLGLIGEAMLHRSNMPAPGSGMTFDEITHKITDHPKLIPIQQNILQGKTGLEQFLNPCDKAQYILLQQTSRRHRCPPDCFLGYHCFSAVWRCYCVLEIMLCQQYIFKFIHYVHCVLLAVLGFF